MALVFTAFSLQYDVADWPVYLLPVFLAFSVWIGMAVGQITALWSVRSTAAPLIIGAVCVAYLGVRTVGNWPRVDASHDLSAERFGRMVMTTAPADAILLAQGDQAVFSLWYFQYGLRQRPDLIVIANDLLGFDWYRANLEHTYGGLRLPTSEADLWQTAIRELNPGRPICYPDPSDAKVNCP